MRLTLLFTMAALSLISKGQTPASNKNNPAKSQWAYTDAQGRLVYKTLQRGDRIMDFSSAGYMGGGVDLPSASVKITLTPSPGDNTDAIQTAIDAVSKMPVVKGLRGAVLLSPGTYNCERALTLTASGVVLRGSGSGQNGTIINMTGAPHTCITLNGDKVVRTVGRPTTISSTYVPSGAQVFDLTDASGFAAGDTIRISRPVTAAWITFMGMDQLVRDGKKQTWVSGEMTAEHIVRKIEKNTVTIDIPLTDSYDAAFTAPSGTTVQKITTSGEESQMGVESLRIVSPAQSVTINDGHHRALTMNGVVDCWVRNLEIYNTVNSISLTAKRITVDSISIIHETPTLGAAKPADLTGNGPQQLFSRCRITGDNLFFFATGAKVSGPIVLLDCSFHGNGWIQPHQRWSTGLLVDGCEVPDGGIDFMNRGEMGSGHGWAIGWAVAWNCRARSYLNQQPPGSANWVIGCLGEPQQRAMPFNTAPLLPEGIYDAQGAPVSPASLYRAQLSARLGKKVAK